MNLHRSQALAATIASGDLTSTVLLRRNDTSSLLASLDSMQGQCCAAWYRR
ncbi:hypothetical protein WDV93_22980 [Pantoea ananatis]